MFKLTYTSSNLSKKKPPSAPSSLSIPTAPAAVTTTNRSKSSALPSSSSSSFARPTAASIVKQNTLVIDTSTASVSSTSVSSTNIYSVADEEDVDDDEQISQAASATSKPLTSLTVSGEKVTKPKAVRNNNNVRPKSVDVSTIGSISSIRSSNSSSSRAASTISTSTSSSLVTPKFSKEVAKLEKNKSQPTESSQSPRRDPPPTPVPSSQKFSPRRQKRTNTSREENFHRQNNHHVHFVEGQAEDDLVSDPLLQVANIFFKRNVFAKMIYKSGIHRANRYADALHHHHQRTTTRLHCFTKWRCKVGEHRLRTVLDVNRRATLASCFLLWNAKWQREANCRILQERLSEKRELNLPRQCFLLWRGQVYAAKRRPLVRVVFDKWKHKALNLVLVTKLVSSLQQKCWDRWKLRMAQKKNEVFASRIHRRVLLVTTLVKWRNCLERKQNAIAEELVKDFYWKKSCFLKWRRKYRDAVSERRIQFSILMENSLLVKANDENYSSSNEDDEEEETERSDESDV